MKVTGKERDDGEKDYLLSHEKNTYTAVKSGNLFCCEGTTDTLKAIKQMIEDGMIGAVESKDDIANHDRATAHAVWLANDIGNVESKDDIANHDRSPDPTVGMGLWGCVHPCALLVLTVGDRALNPEMREQFLLTLDNFGWLTEGRSPDYRRAMRDYNIQTERNANSKAKDETLLGQG